MNTFSNGLFNEQAFALTVNGRNLLSVLMLPDLPDEFARGYLATEAIIPADEIESIMIDGATIGVLTSIPFKVLLPKRAVISGCGGTASYLDPARLPVISGGITIPADTLATPFPENILAAGGFCAAAVLPDGKPTGDTIRKTLNAGFSILAAYQPPTALAVELAKTGSLTLADIPHKKIHTGPERIR